MKLTWPVKVKQTDVCVSLVTTEELYKQHVNKRGIWKGRVFISPFQQTQGR